MRFQTSNAGGKPVIFWDQQSNQKSNKKKFGYKDRGLKIPLRASQQEEEPEALPPPKTKRPPAHTYVAKENKINKNVTAVSTKSSKQNGTSKTQSKGKGDTKKKPSSDQVTLTQGQFDKILETIGELTLLAEDKENTGGDVKPAGTSNATRNHVPALQVSNDFYNGDEPPLLEVSPAQTPLPTKNVQSNQQSQPGQPNQLFVDNSTTAVPKLDIASPRYYDPRSVPDGPISGNTRSSTLGVPLGHLTKAERKRIEWERERAEQEERLKQIQHTQKLHGGGNPTSQQHPSAQTVQQPETVQQRPPPPAAVVQQQVPTAVVQQQIPAQQSYVQQPVNSDLPVTRQQGPVIKNEPSHVPGITSTNPQPAVSFNASQITNNAAAHVTGVVDTSQQSQPFVQSNPQSVPGLSHLTNHQQPSPRTVLQQQQPQSQTGSNNAQPPVSKPPLSKAELKRLKWEKERAELSKVTEWDPWGRPGAGAPVKGSDGNILTDYSTRRSMETGETPRQIQPPNIAANYNSGDIIRQSYEQVPPSQQQFPAATANHQNQAPPPAQIAMQQGPQQPSLAMPTQQPLSMIGQPGAEPPPAAIRSSFNIGAVAPDENKFQSAKQRQRQQWIADLEKQREEDRLRKQQQIQKDLELDRKDAMINNYKAGGLVEQVVQQMPQQQQYQQIQQPQLQPPTQPQPQTLQQQPQQGGFSLPSQTDTQQAMPDTFIRGQNTFIDPVTMKELGEKRQKQLEYQEYIRQQMDEKENKKKAEREKKWREEIEEERKLQKERDDIQAQLDKEQGKVRDKKEKDKKKVELLKQAIDEQKERAEWEKHEKRMMKLRKGGHDVANYHTNFQVQHPLPTRTPSEMTIDLDAKHTPRDGMASVMTVAPSFIPGLGNIEYNSSIHQSRDNAPSQQTSYPSPVPLPVDASYEQTARSYRPPEPYTENRVLTPSVFRSGQHQYVNHGTTGREFGVQADLIGGNLSRESTDIEFKGPIKKKVRVKSAAELKAAKETRQKTTGFGSTYSKSAEPPKSAPVKGAAPAKSSLKPILKNKKPIPVSKRPAWGQHNSKNTKKLVKQSERDPFYDVKKQRSESSKVLRQQMLLELAEQEAPRVSQKSTLATRARSRSRSRGPDNDYHDLEQFTEPGSVHVATTNFKTGERIRLHSRSRSRSPPAPVPNLYSGQQGRNSRVDYSNWSRTSNRSVSPPVPALKHKIPGSTTPSHGKNSHRIDSDYNVDTNNYDSFRGNQMDVNKNSKYLDYNVVGAPVQNGQFVPFIRSTNVLDPAHAEDPMPVSREPSTMQKARKAYVQEHEPARYGTVMENFEDSRIIRTVQPQGSHYYDKDPITNPSVVKDHPTQRQNKILQQLSDLRKGLRQKQMELDVGLQSEEVMG